ncbi:MAG: hypothetical protein P4L38_02980 [Syntrophaceae bacterium]|nr:hypothetical protein [Syntrophaceae bacterium]
MFTQRLKIAVLGSAREPENSEISKKAFKLGQEIGRQEGIVLTGGCPGVPHMASLGAKAVGGLTLAVSPALNRTEHLERYCYPADSDIIIFTGMGNKGRNVILVRSADVAIFLGGGIGTLNEFTIAFDDFTHENVIGFLSGSGRLSDFFDEIVAKSGRTPGMAFFTEDDPVLLVQKACQEFSQNINRNSK